MAKNEVDLMTLTPEQRDARLALDVERLLRFGRKHKLIKDLDVLVARNTLLDLLALAAPSEAKLPEDDADDRFVNDGGTKASVEDLLRANMKKPLN